MHYDRVFSFGDSLTDTGNAAILPATAGGPFTRAPYNKTFHHPGGRASDSRLIIDFIGKHYIYEVAASARTRTLSCKFLTRMARNGVARVATADAVPRRQD